MVHANLELCIDLNIPATIYFNEQVMNIPAIIYFNEQVMNIPAIIYFNEQVVDELKHMHTYMHVFITQFSSAVFYVCIHTIPQT
jgi:hypothetical protein